MNTIRQYIAWCEKRIARLVVAEGLHVGLLGVVQGPLTITFRVRLLQPSSRALRSLLGLGPAVATAIQAESVRVLQLAGAVHLEIPSPVRRTPAAPALASHSHGLTVCVGYNALRTPVFVNLEQHGALFWIGPSRRGKTQSMKATLYALVRAIGSRLKYVILCHAGKRDNWQAFAAAIGCMGIVTDPAEHGQVLAWATATLLQHARGSFVYVIVVDDLLNLLSNADLAGPLGDLASMGAGLGVHLLAGTQETGSKRGSGGAGVEANITAKILYKPANAATGARSAGQKGVNLEALTGAKGDALLLLDGFGERIATAWADDRDILQLPAKVNGCGLLAPWRQTDSAQRSEERPQNGLEAPETGENAQNGAVLAFPAPTHAPTRAGEAGERADEPVLHRSDLLPLPGNRPPTAPERLLLRELYTALGSKEKVYFKAWGYKNGKVQQYLTAALTEDSGQKTADGGQITEVRGQMPEGRLLNRSDNGKAHIDMNTPEGQAAVERMITQGLLPRDTICAVVSYRAVGPKEQINSHGQAE